VVLAERLREIGQHASALSDAQAELAPMLQGVIRGVGSLRDRLLRAAGERTVAKAAPVLAPAVASPPAAVVAVASAAPPSGQGPPVPQPLGNGFERVPGAALDINLFGQALHPFAPLRARPAEVFIGNIEGPWIAPDAATTEALVTVAHMCPSGAIQYQRHDGGAEEAPPPVNLLQLRENGPLGFRAQLLLDGEAIGMRATLCRCGASRRKPFCDGSHNEIRFPGHRRATEQARHRAAGGARRAARRGSGDQRAAGGQRQPGDVLRHRPHLRQGAVGAAMPLWRVEEQAVLRQLASHERLHELATRGALVGHGFFRSCTSAGALVIRDGYGLRRCLPRRTLDFHKPTFHQATAR
jgi:CDGSH-type Zn-finger protein/uncharacterized Fe-S cluster protein YjdI